MRIVKVPEAILCTENLKRREGEERFAGFCAQLDEKRTGVPTVTGGKPAEDKITRNLPVDDVTL